MKEKFLPVVWEGQRRVREFRLDVFISLVNWEVRSSTKNKKDKNRNGHLNRMEKINKYEQ